jgi:hypothetical protein
MKLSALAATLLVVGGLTAAAIPAARALAIVGNGSLTTDDYFMIHP